MPQVELREITQQTLRPILQLTLQPGQERFVASNAISLAQALFHPEAWYRGIYADGEAVGFLMLEDHTRLTPPKAEVYLWRFMIAAPHQRRGLGRLALDALLAELRDRAQFTELLTSYVPGEGGPEGFYLGYGFVPTGELEEGEVMLRLPL